MLLQLQLLSLPSASVVRALWFILEIIMAKNENNSHALIRKMVENIKQSKDAQAVSDAKTNEVCKTPAAGDTSTCRV